MTGEEDYDPPSNRAGIIAVILSILRSSYLLITDRQHLLALWWKMI